MGQEISGPGARHQPAPGALSVFRRGTGQERSPRLNLNFRSRLPALSGAQGDSQRPRPRRRFAGPITIHFVWPKGQHFREPSASVPLCGPREGWNGSGSAPAPSGGWSGQCAGERRPPPRNPPPYTLSQPGKKMPRAEKSSVPNLNEKQEPTSSSPGNFRAPSQKRKLLARNFLKR